MHAEDSLFLQLIEWAEIEFLSLSHVGVPVQPQGHILRYFMTISCYFPCQKYLSDNRYSESRPTFYDIYLKGSQIITMILTYLLLLSLYCLLLRSTVIIHSGCLSCISLRQHSYEEQAMQCVRKLKNISGILRKTSRNHANKQLTAVGQGGEGNPI